MYTQPTTYKSAEEALSVIQSGDRVFLHGSAATPSYLIKKLAERADELRDVELVSISTFGDMPVADPKYSDSFYINSLFVSANVREAVNSGRGDYVPIFLSEIPKLFRSGIMPLDVAIVHVSPPDRHGFCSLGVSVDIAREAVLSAKHVIAQVNPQMPRTHGDALIHTRRFDALVEVNEPLPEVDYSQKISSAEEKIGKYIAEMVDDGATLQMGIGGIPDAVLGYLTNHQRLGIHTEMFSNGILPLVEKGVITNEHKKKHPGRIATGFIVGNRQLYDFVDDNPLITMLRTDYVNDVTVIRTNPKMTAINSAIEIDLTGQVVSDSIGTYQYSGIGGQMDFMRGAALSKGGKPIIALPSITHKGISRITPFINQGAGVVTTRAHVHYVVTEYGVAYLYGKNLRQRAKALIGIAHPDHRERLEEEALKRFRHI
ncbi:acetyl-CoA hydrolase/transferase family protein [Pontibacter diazotrophicus]|uniref:Acetyl-CoA hydrolase/transferase family protein n=1 Tax=Pontibacter diazotrophicus TaxID=1400979 RepID=A0A3D8L9E7_9BACT|nr:acetyl-CoA hydrolase/transferase C-terminal domain-containing protein [Pontibacter diazotrophicus]RDV14030.1 acetyl-CoA hydrolase/transferase family protein [Pontibacter diazotrophicus]